jgi:hypothetical protein
LLPIVVWLAVRFQQAARQRGRALEQHSLPGAARLAEVASHFGEAAPYKGAEKAVDFATSAGDHDHDALALEDAGSLVAGTACAAARFCRCRQETDGSFRTAHERATISRCFNKAQAYLKIRGFALT